MGFYLLYLVVESHFSMMKRPGVHARAAQQTLELLTVRLDTPLWLVLDLRQGDQKR